MTNTRGNRGGGGAVMAAVFIMLAGAISAPAQTFTTLLAFDDSPNGAFPTAPLVQGSDGNLWGTTSSGGSGEGTVFKITPAGVVTTVYNFCAGSGFCTDGSLPEAPLVLGTDGNFYGTTNAGGSSNCMYGCGTVFKLTQAGTLTTLYSFEASSSPDGAFPTAGLVQGNDGNFYGTTPLGGTNDVGTLFKVTPTGTLTILYNFCAEANCADGAFPIGNLVLSTNGYFYGTTSGGQGFGNGTVFRLTTSGNLTTLYTFCALPSCADGSTPYGGVAVGIDGNLYGTTAGGGANNHGTVFKLTPAGKLTTLYSFCAMSGCTDGEDPQGELVQATDGNFYGTTTNGGANGSCLYGSTCGTIFKITSTGSLTTLYSFCPQSGCADGEEPVAALFEHTNGTLYGTAPYGGTVEPECSFGCGTVFSLSEALGAFVRTVPTAGKVGKSVSILGTNFTGAIGVTFNGTPATFKVVSSTSIKTSVPTGATTGPVQVLTPSGTLTSNVNFQVVP